MSFFSAVSIAPTTEVISPLILGNRKEVDDLDLDLSNGRRSKRNSLVKTPSKRLTGRLPYASSPTLRSNSGKFDDSIPPSEPDSSNSRSESRHSGHHLEHLVDQVQAWIKAEREKRADRKARKHAPDDPDIPGSNGADDGKGGDESVDTFSLDHLQSIIESNLKMERRSRFSRHRSPNSSRHRPSIAKLRKASSASDTDFIDTEVAVPTCDAVLDNSKTLSYTGGASDDSGVSSNDELERTVSYRDRDAWAVFKFEIVRLSHTLRLKGWRRFPMDWSHEIEVKRLSGAMTNAVYEVSPPIELPSSFERENGDNSTVSILKKPPPKLLLRIYGSNVDHLIDREKELAILRRLARKRIGPCLLGTFANGRFEEYLNALPLTAEDFRCPDTSRHIAKRMRELHDGIELEEEERDDGPFVWQNWDKWAARLEKIVSWLDREAMKLKPDAKPTGQHAWKRRGYICGAPWHQFRDMVEKYRKWLYRQYGGTKHIREELVFSHNDTQYGNILRLKPTGQSPLLLPVYAHKQLVVIDFEYANANLPGLEFANHFTEWCYNYSDPRKPYAFHSKWYPTPEEQERFIRAYVRHRPQFNVSTPKLSATNSTVSMSSSIDTLRRPTSSISDFMAEARTPQVGPSAPNAEDTAHKASEDQEVERLMRETRLWRLANTAQWVAWGVIQAKVPGMPDFDGEEQNGDAANGEDAARQELGEGGDEYRELDELRQQATENAPDEQEEAEDEFDYLGYAHHRAMFFWADALQNGLVKAEDLPEDLLGKVKNVPY